MTEQCCECGIDEWVSDDEVFYHYYPAEILPTDADFGEWRELGYVDESSIFPTHDNPYSRPLLTRLWRKAENYAGVASVAERWEGRGAAVQAINPDDVRWPERTGLTELVRFPFESDDGPHGLLISAILAEQVRELKASTRANRLDG